MSIDVQISCTNVFKNSNNTLLKNDFNKKIIELINQIEKNKVCNMHKEDLQVISDNI